ncbi:response regulator transcription factor [Bacillus sp. FJAT-44742]|uniref:response regulator transcription factor n=1 Tax=Bacillus sp. FJAT-44742 TaxID=2014005 RepID=UPI000C245BCE|nr:response regulator transcription factor [Bacillus sp. FJAT-44742]
MKDKILIVDDESEMRKLLHVCMSQSPSFQADSVESGEKALEKIEANQYDLLLLDIMMPGMSGLEVITYLKERRKKDIPIILISALGETDHVVEGLNLGADDYIVKPFEPKELLARVSSVIRRTGKRLQENGVFTIHGLAINVEKMRVAYKNEIISFTSKEFSILKRMAMHPGRVYTREQLVELEWQDFYEGEPRNIDTHVKNIREKLKKAGCSTSVIKTVWGVGYQVAEEDRTK